MGGEGPGMTTCLCPSGYTGTHCERKYTTIAGIKLVSMCLHMMVGTCSIQCVSSYWREILATLFNSVE